MSDDPSKTGTSPDQGREAAERTGPMRKDVERELHKRWAMAEGSSERPVRDGAYRVLHSSPNGDRWLLVRDDSGRVLVRHQPNAPSGGRVSELDVGAFLARGGHGPEHQELLRLIGALVDQD